MPILKKDNKPSRANATDPDLTLEFWANVFQPYLDHPAQAFIAAQIFSKLKQTLNRGPQGVAAVTESLEVAIDLLFPLSDFYPACVELYRLAAEGKLLPQFEPQTIVSKAKEPTSA